MGHSELFFSEYAFVIFFVTKQLELFWHTPFEMRNDARREEELGVNLLSHCRGEANIPAQEKIDIGVRAIFCRGGGGELFSQKILTSCPNVYETVVI